jgi:hypothetical protein
VRRHVEASVFFFLSNLFSRYPDAFLHIFTFPKNQYIKAVRVGVRYRKLRKRLLSLAIGLETNEQVYEKELSKVEKKLQET